MEKWINEHCKEGNKYTHAAEYGRFTCGNFVRIVPSDPKDIFSAGGMPRNNNLVYVRLEVILDIRKGGQSSSHEFVADVPSNMR